MFQEDTALSLTQQVLLEHLLSLKVQIQSLTFRSFGLERRLCLEFFFNLFIKLSNLSDCGKNLCLFNTVGL